MPEERLTLQIVLADVAARALVSVQPVLRHFGSREALFGAAHARRLEQGTRERAAPVGEVRAAVAVLVEHSEATGGFVLRMLAQEHVDDRVREVFAPPARGTARRRRTHRPARRRHRPLHVDAAAPRRRLPDAPPGAGQLPAGTRRPTENEER